MQALTDAVNEIRADLASFGEDISSLNSKTDSLQNQVNTIQLILNQQQQKPVQFNAYAKIDSIPGESADDKHKDWIDVLSYELGATLPVELGQGGQLTGKASLSDFSIVKPLDKSSPKLYESLTTGKHIKEVIIELTKTTGVKQKYMEYKLTDVIISSILTSGSSSGQDPSPLEQVSFNYGKIEWKYTELDETGKPKGTIIGCWDIKLNRAC